MQRGPKTLASSIIDHFKIISLAHLAINLLSSYR